MEAIRSSPCLEGCPNEIIEWIVTTLELKDIANLRCTSRSMKVKTTQDRFRRFFRSKSIRLDEAFLSSFVHHTQPGMLGCLVQELDIVGLVQNTERCGPDVLERLQSDLNAQQKAKDVAAVLSRSGRDIELLARAFKNLEGNGRGPIRKLRLAIKVNRDAAVSEFEPLEGGSFKLIWQKAAETLRTTLAALVRSEGVVHELDAFSELRRCAIAGNELSMIDTNDRSIRATMKSLKTLSISVSGRIIARTEEEASELEPPSFQSMGSHKPPTPRDQDVMKSEADDENNFTGLSKLLAQCSNLSTMDLHFYDLQSAVETHRSRYFTRIVENTTFANLTGIRLRGFHVHEEDLLTFVQRSPLRMLNFENLYMEQGTWRALFDYIAKGPQKYDWILVDDLFENRELLYFSGDGDGRPKFPSLCGTVGTNGFLRRGEDVKRAARYHFAADRPYGTPQAYNWRVRRQIEYGPPNGL
ncbi:hypothetical protein DOTSEDRAFT_140560 [Dothistroma septosporum NZE10]|uniref:F-box domain-containing protein n=1 Tax=Dothistroma septosporum (strain NZE10 / CBS 128990) TaxID=675120 RepID=N1PBR6_DOTSN|nr:hypothetical protein DOTSEDRAFT_140560 [Dothistroma septosporum NZE10]